MDKIEQATAAPGEQREVVPPKERWFWKRCGVLSGGVMIMECVARKGHDGPHRWQRFE